MGSQRNAGAHRRLTPVDFKLYRILRSREPWKVLATAYLLKVTRKEQVCLLLPRFFRQFASPPELLASPEAQVRRLLLPLGLWRKRTQELRRLAWRLVKDGPPQSRAEAAALYGAGEYVADCYALFVLRDYAHRPRDYALRHYWAAVRHPCRGGKAPLSRA